MQNKKLKIVHTESSCGWGGQEIRILTEAKGFLGRGHEVTLLCPEQAPIYEEAQQRNIPVVALPIARKKIKGLLAVRRWLKKNSIDIVNTHSSTDSWLMALASKMVANPPVLLGLVMFLLLYLIINLLVGCIPRRLSILQQRVRN